MKRFPAIICSLLLVFVLFSCKNLTLTEKNRNTDSGKGTVFIRIPEVDATSRAAIVQAPGDVTKYSIRFYLVNKDEPVFSKDYTSAELNKGVTIDLDPNDYKIHIDASDAKGLLFTGETASLVHVTLENTADNPAVASVFMKMVLACYDTGSEALVRYNGNTVLDGNVVPDVLVPVVQRLPEGNRTAANGYVITGWKDSNNDDQIYDAEEPIDLDGKKLPLRLTAVWGEPVERVKVHYNTNLTDDSATPPAEKVVKDRAFALTYPEAERLDEGNDPYRFCGWSVNTRFPLLTTENYTTEMKAAIKEAGVVTWGASIALTAEETTFYAVWASTDFTSDDMFFANCTLGDDTSNPAASKTVFYLKDLMPVEEIEENNWFHFTLPSIQAIFPQWNETSEGTIKDNYWTINYNGSPDTTAAGKVYDITANNYEIALQAKIKVPVARYFDGGDQYGTVEREYPEPEYVTTWPLYEPVDLRGGELNGTGNGTFGADFKYGTNSSLWRFDHWVDQQSGKTYSPGWTDLSEVPVSSLPLKLSARWTLPIQQTGNENYLEGAVAISSVYELKSKISTNPSGKFYLTKNLTIRAQDLTAPITDTFTGLLYGNNLTIDFQGTTSSLFNEIGTGGEIIYLNLSGSINYSGYNSSLPVKSLLCQTNNGSVGYCQYRLKEGTLMPTVDCIFGGYAPGNASKYEFYSSNVTGTIQQWDAEEGWVNYTETMPTLTKVIAPETGYAGSFAGTRYYQYSDVLWNSPLEASKAFSFTLSGNQPSSSVSADACAFLMLKDITVSGSSVTAKIYKYSGESDGAGTKVGSDSSTIGAVTKYGVVISQGSSTFFLFTGEGLNRYNALTADEVSGYRMSSAMIINAPATESAINDELGGLVRLSSADDVLAVMNDTRDSKYTKQYYVENDIDMESLPKSLFEKQFNGTFDGQRHTITVGTGSAPLFKDIGASGEVCNLTLKGNFFTYTEPYTEPYRDFGVLCSNNYGKLHDCSFEGTAPSSTSIGTVSVFGYQAPGSTNSNNANSSSAADTSDMYQITMIPIIGTTVSESIGAGAFASASTESVTVGNFLIAEAEVTYKQWYEVYKWATSAERGSNIYTFSSTGLGYGGTAGAEPTADTATKPVTNIYYRDMIVWCNAASEKQGLDPVYYAEGTTGDDFLDNTKVVRVVNASLRNAEKAVPNPAANGYRLPEAKEWEYAARGGDLFDTTAWKYTYAGSDTLQGIAVHYSCYINGVSGSKYSHVENVKTLKPNTAGLYDMSGNAGEYLFLLDSVSGNRNKSGDKGNIAALNTVDPHTSVATASTGTEYDGFRVVRSIGN